MRENTDARKELKDFTETGKQAYRQASTILATDFIRRGHAVKRVRTREDSYQEEIQDASELIQMAYYSLNTVIKYTMERYSKYMNDYREEVITIISEALLMSDAPEYNERQPYFKKLSANISYMIRKEFYTAEQELKTAQVLGLMSAKYKVIKANLGQEKAREYWKGFSKQFQEEYKQVFILPDENASLRDSAESVEMQAIDNITLDMLAQSDALTKTERETLNAIRYGTFFTGKTQEGATNRKKLERLISKSKIVLGL